MQPIERRQGMGQIVQESSPGGPPTALEFVHVHKRFDGKEGPEEVLHDISGTVEVGDVIAIVGPSGAGKSTLLSLGNLLQSVDEGTVRVFGKPVSEWDVRALRRTVGVVFQTPTVLPGTVEDNLLASIRLHGGNGVEGATHLQRVGLSAELLTKNADDLSGGQKQRVAIARTLVNEPQVLLLDEITSALDVAAAREVEDLLLQLRQDKHLTLLWITHNLEQARRVATKVWVMVDGRLVERAPVEKLFTTPEHPLTREFLDGKLSGGHAG